MVDRVEVVSILIVVEIVLTIMMAFHVEMIVLMDELIRMDLDQVVVVEWEWMENDKWD